jgi:hypothetical protein
MKYSSLVVVFVPLNVVERERSPIVPQHQMDIAMSVVVMLSFFFYFFVATNGQIRSHLLI